MSSKQTWAPTVSWEASDWGILSAATHLKRQLAIKSSTQAGQSSDFCRLSVNHVKPNHTTETNLLHSKKTNLNVNLIQKHPHGNIQSNV